MKNLLAGIGALLILGTLSSVSFAESPKSKGSIKKVIKKKELMAIEPAWASVADMLIESSHWKVSSLLQGSTDPHGFSPTPVMLKSLHDANLTIVNGGGYDNWAKSKVPSSRLVLISNLSVKGETDPHYFLDPSLVELAASKIHQSLVLQTPKSSHEILVRKKLEFDKHIELLKDKIARLRKRALGKDIAVTELAGSKILKEMGFNITDENLALAITEGRNVSPQLQAKLESDIKGHKVAFLVVNPTHMGGVGNYLEEVARQNHLPVVKIPEAMPEGKTWLEWINAVVDDTAAALAASQLGTTVN